MRKNWQGFFYDAPTVTGDGISSLGVKAPKADDDTALLDNLIDSKPKKEDKEVIEPEDEVLEEPEESLLEEESDTEDDELLVGDDTNNRGLDLTKIKEKYPDFAKTTDFRLLRDAYHREGKYTELFPTLEDAREAAENNETFQRINTDLVNRGDISSLLNGVKEANPESFKKITTGFLDTIAKIDNNLYVETITPVVKRLARQIYEAGQKAFKRNADSDEGKALVATAKNIMQWAFEDVEGLDREEPRADPKISAKEEELSKREQAIAQEKFMGAYRVCDTSVERHLDKLITEGLDPDNRFNEFTRDTLLEKIKNEVKGQISKDQLHLRKMTSLWKRAEQSGFNRESLSSIVSAYLERARPIIPNVRNKFRSIAIKGRTVSADNGNEDTNDTRDKNIRLVNRGRTGRTASNEGRVVNRAVDPKKVDYKNTSDDDIFEGRIKLKS